jgi:hypothetical protein
MVDKQIGKAIADLLIFLEFSSDDVIDADASVAMIEQVAAVLQEASDPVRADLAQCFGALSNEYGNRAEFVASLPETLGLI